MFSLRIYVLKKEREHGMENGQGGREHASSHAWVDGNTDVNSMSTKADFFPPTWTVLPVHLVHFSGSL